LFGGKECENAFEERLRSDLLLDLEWLDFQGRFEDNDIERIYEVDRSVLESIIYLSQEVFRLVFFQALAE